jgi:hypothetical protein
MKQCPLCKEHFADEQLFCDADGTPLIEKVRKGPGLNAEALPPVENGRANQVWPIVTIGVLIGVIICLTAYAVMMTPPVDKANSRTDSAKLNPSERSLPATTVRSEPLPVASIPEPSPEASPTETASPTPAVAEASEAPAAALNTGPISTDRQEGEKRGHMLIKLKSGVTVEADAAWADRLGIWYRQGGLVSYVERDRIESIAEPPQPKNSPTETNKP